MVSLNPFRTRHEARMMAALRQSFAVIEFSPTGEILAANDLFLKTMGYSAAEIKGQHHRLFVAPDYAGTQAYADFWLSLGRGNFDTGEYRRFASGGREVWLQASYTPVRASNGKVLKIIKLALDITAAHAKAAEDLGKLDALGRVQAVIEFKPDGTILTANANFLNCVGYRLEEVVGQHHRMFVEPAQAASAEYQAFWRQLNAGEFVSAEYSRVGKNGRKIWLQASYNPVFDAQGRVIKVVKFASDLTERMRQVGVVGAGLASLARGDLGAEIGETLMPSLDRLRIDFNASATALRDTMQNIAESATAIYDTSGAVSKTADQLAQRTERQAANLEETASAMDQITATVRKTAESAAQVREVVRSAKTDTETSGTVVEEAVQAMSRIDASSTQISNIIGVIDSIAFQTNLLALNAGVEAARAGDAGRGFAVVATEVRALAQRSADAAKEIKMLISASVQEVAGGVKYVGDARAALERIAAHVITINGAITEIAASASEQSEGLGQINSAVNQMDQLTQQNAAMVEEAAAASQNLAREAGEITQMLSRFDTGKTPRATAPRTQARQPARVPELV